MKEKTKNILGKARAWTISHKKAFIVAGIIALVLILLCGIAFLSCYFYVSSAYPDEIVLEGAYVDTSLLPLSFTDRDLKNTYTKEGAVVITAQGNTANADNQGVTFSDSVIKITAGGVYIFEGSFEGMILVEGGDEDKIQLVLNSFAITGKSSPAIYVKSANKVFITTAEGTVNTITDTNGYSYEGGDVDGAIFSRADLTLNGTGELIVKGNNAHGIVSKDDLVIGDGKYNVSSVKKGIFGKDCVKINTCDLTINAGTDGICSDNTDSDKGFVYIKSGTISITAAKDGIQSKNAMVLQDPKITISTDGGYENAPVKEANRGKGKHEKGEREEEAPTDTTKESAKALKSATDIIISGGTYIINSRDDSIHADNSIKITDGAFNIKSGDDGIHAENTLEISKGDITIENCFEGLEAYQIAINGGNVLISATDDGVNASSSTTALGFFGELFSPSAMGKLEIHGGLVQVYSGGDSLDSNGIMSLLGGKVFLSGPTSQGDSMVDCDSTKTLSGATLVVIGTSKNDTAESLATSKDFFEIENSYTLSKDLDTQEAGTAIEIKGADGNTLAAFTAQKSFNYIIATSPKSFNLLLNGTELTE